MSPELAASAGERLKQARLKKGDTLEEASRRTRVPKKYLAAIEEGRPDDLPAPVYFEGFLKIYCDYLGLGLETLRPQEAAAPAVLAETASRVAAAAAAPPPAHRQDAAHAGHAGSRERPSNYGRVLAASALILAGSSVWLWRLSVTLGGVAFSARPQALAPLSAAALSSAPGGRAQSASFREDLTIIVHEDAWLRVLADGKLVFKGETSRGQMQEWKARKVIVLDTGKLGAFDLMLNGAPYAPAPSASGRYVIRAP